MKNNQIDADKIVKHIKYTKHWLDKANTDFQEKNFASGSAILNLARAELTAAVARCEIDHAVPALSIHGGLAPARERLRQFVRHGLARYDVDRREPSAESRAPSAGPSRLSPWLHFGMISPAEVVRAIIAAAPPDAARASFLDEIVVWRELALNLCHRTSRFRTMHALPDWARRTLAAHDADRREAKYSLAQLERAGTHDPLWNAAQRELLATGVIHNAVRQLWGKSLLRWTQRPAEALRRLIHLNDRWAIDGRDPNSYANILWCLGKFDRPFAERPVWGMVRPMMLERAGGKFDVDAYTARWNV
jgi:deoxyribodipyrimidine photo-lyase